LLKKFKSDSISLIMNRLTKYPHFLPIIFDIHWKNWLKCYVY